MTRRSSVARSMPRDAGGRFVTRTPPAPKLAGAAAQAAADAAARAERMQLAIASAPRCWTCQSPPELADAGSHVRGQIVVCPACGAQYCSPICFRAQCGTQGHGAPAGRIVELCKGGST